MKNKQLTYRIFIPLLLICALGAQGLSAKPPKKEVQSVLKGQVVDENNNPLNGVVIRIADEDKGALSDPDGTFDIIGVKALGQKVLFSKDGYANQTVSADDLEKVPVVMQPDASNKDQMIALARGKRSNQSVTAAVSTISGDELAKTPHHNLGAALAGRLPGLIVRQGSNEPGMENYTSNVRGTSTTNGRTPLILIDGIVSSSYDHINPRDVESVTVLKDAAATALYGMQGGNGILSIVTKRGEYGKPRISVNADYTFQAPIRTSKMLNSGQYASLINEASENDGLGKYAVYQQTDIDKYLSGENQDLYPNNNWYDMFMKSTVQTQKVDLTASGGSEFMKYYTSLGYMHQDSPFVTDGSQAKAFGINRYDIRTNVDVKINKYVKGYMNLAGRVQRNNVTNTNDGTGAVVKSLFDMAPNIYGPLTPDGKVIATSQFTNPTYGRINRDGYRKQINTHVSAIIGLDVDLGFITKGLSTNGQVAFYTNALSNIHGQTNYERWIRDDSKPDVLEFLKYGATSDQPLTLGKGVSYAYRSEFEWSIDYQRQLGKHAVYGHGLISKQYENAANLTTGILPYVMMTYGIQAGYSFNNVLFADFTASYQGSEAFAKGRRYGFFPTGSAAWVISNHAFLKNNKTISNLKLRVSYGMVGNADIGGERRYLYKDNFQTGAGGFIGAWGQVINESQFGNPLITWEKSKIMNVGLELGLWNQFTLTFDYFKDRRNDILTNRNTIPGTSGILADALPPANIGEISNQGFELQLAYRKALTKDWTINAVGYIALNKNEVQFLDELMYSKDYAYRYRNTGYSVGQQWGYQIDYLNGNGYFNSIEDIERSGLTYDGQAPRPGDFIYKDLNSDHIIDEKDMAPMGYNAIPEISWGVNLAASWKSLDVSLLFQGLSRTSQFYSGCGFFESYQSGTFFEQHLNAWTPERHAAGSKITAPALALSSSSSQRSNDYYLNDKSFVRLKNVEIGYRLPLSWARKLTCQSIRVYVSGINLLTFDNMKSKDLDVEMNNVTIFPTYRYMNVGLNITF